MKSALEYLLYRLLAFAVPLLPRRAMVFLGRRLGGLYLLVNRRVRAVGRENLGRVFPERTDRECILRESARLQGVAVLDALWMRSTTERAHRLVLPTARATELLRDPIDPKMQRVVATAHFGSWEMFLSVAGMLHVPPTVVIARPVGNALIDRHIKRVRQRKGIVIADREGALWTCAAALRRKEYVCSVIDMAILPREGGIYVDFFGTPALTSIALGALAVRFGAPLVFAICRPIDKGRRYVLDAERIEVDFAPPDRNEEARHICRRLNQALEHAIRSCPEPWIWSYKRWKARPCEVRGSYPSYSLWMRPDGGRSQRA